MLAVGLLLLGSLLLRIWGADHGLPYAYNSDENAHFVPRAIGHLRPRVEPGLLRQPARLHVPRCTSSSAVWFGGREGVSRLFATDPTEVWVVARTVVGGARHDGRRAAVPRRRAALRPPRRPARARRSCRSPSCRSSTRTLALNDVPMLAPICLASGASRASCAPARTRDFVLAGVGPGAGVRDEVHGGHRAAAADRRRRRAVRGAGRSRPGAARGLVVARHRARSRRSSSPTRTRCSTSPPFWDGITHQSVGGGRGRRASSASPTRTASSTTCGRSPGASAGCRCSRRSRRCRCCGSTSGGWCGCSCPAPILFVVFMGTQERYFGRWLMPVFPFVCMLAAYAAVEARRPRGPPLAGARSRRCSPSARSRCARRASCTRCTSARCSPARTRATSPASGSSTTCRRGRRSSSSPSCPTRGRRTSATRRG